MNRTGSLIEGTLHVWRVEDSQPAETLESLRSILSEDELTRAAAYRFESDRSQFIICRGVLRKLLGEYLNRSPKSLLLDYGPRGKPSLIGDRLQFNVSHTRGICVLAFGRGAPLGVDVEAIDEQTDIDAIARRQFHPDEWEAMNALGPSQRRAAFFAIWACKEAWLKATGEGLGGTMESFRLLPPPVNVQEVVVQPTAAGASPGWAGLVDLGERFAAAIASPTRPTAVRLFSYP